MNTHDANLCKENGFFNPRSLSYTFSDTDSICTTNGLVPLPLEAVSAAYRGDLANGIYEFDIANEHGQTIAILCLCKDYCYNVGDVNPNQITEAQFAAYIHEIDVKRIELPFRFSRDYLVVEEKNYQNYKTKYMQSAPIWGGFLHQQKVARLPAAHTYPPTSIVATPHINFPTPFHEESAVRSIVEPYAFERYLKLYHLLELLFDFDVVRSIQQLGSDLHGIAQILSGYQAKEYERLKDIIRRRCLGISGIEDCLNKINSDPSYMAIVADMLFTFGKDNTNPLNDITDLQNILNQGGFSRASVQAARISGLGQYEAFVIKFATYVIYRIRCSIAHNRIGEYVMTNKDEPFVVHFGEPLLREILKQALA